MQQTEVGGPGWSCARQSGPLALRMYTAQNPEVSLKALASRIGVSHSMLCHYRTGWRIPKRPVRILIEIETKGAVPERVWDGCVPGAKFARRR